MATAHPATPAPAVRHNRPYQAGGNDTPAEGDQQRLACVSVAFSVMVAFIIFGIFFFTFANASTHWTFTNLVISEGSGNHEPADRYFGHSRRFGAFVRSSAFLQVVVAAECLVGAGDLHRDLGAFLHKADDDAVFPDRRLQHLSVGVDCLCAPKTSA